MGKVTDINKFKRTKNNETSEPETEGGYLTIVVGETIDEEDIILIEQCEVVGNTKHKDTIIMDEEMLHILISELIVAAGVIKGKESE